MSGRSTRRAKSGLTKQDVESLGRVRAWLETLEGSALEVDVLDEIRERVEQHARDAAIFRVRLMNHPDPRRERPGGHGNAWSVADLEMLQIYYRDELTLAEIGERLGRTQAAVEKQVLRMGLRRAKLRNPITKGHGGRKRWNDGSGVLGRARELRERRQDEMRGRKEAIA